MDGSKNSRFTRNRGEGRKNSELRGKHLSECIIRELQFYGISMGLGTLVLCVYPLYISLTALLITISYEDYGDVGGGRGWEETHAWVHHSTESERDNPLNNAHAVTAILIGFERKTERMLLTLGRLCKRTAFHPLWKQANRSTCSTSRAPGSRRWECKWAVNLLRDRSSGSWEI